MKALPCTVTGVSGAIDLLVAEVAGVILEGQGAGVGGHHGHGAVPTDLEGGGAAGVGEIDQAVGAWEAALAATAVHYINDTIKDTRAIGTEDYSFADHAKHWSEMKGFALSLQFNPRSAVSDADFVSLHTLMGTRPVLGDASEGEREAYLADLLAARDILGQSYGFDAADLGDDHGENGW